jgi:hypothetical protein
MQAMAEKSFAKIWDNDEDAEYDKSIKSAQSY